MCSGASPPHPPHDCQPFQTRASKAKDSWGTKAQGCTSFPSGPSFCVRRGLGRLSAAGSQRPSGRQPSPRVRSLLHLCGPAGGPPGPGAATPTTRVLGHRGAPGASPPPPSPGAGTLAAPKSLYRELPRAGSRHPDPSPRLRAAARSGGRGQRVKHKRAEWKAGGRAEKGTGTPD